jgi:hypothetical protein
MMGKAARAGRVCRLLAACHEAISPGRTCEHDLIFDIFHEMC